MANINRVLSQEKIIPSQPIFGAGNCYYGTIGKSETDNDLYIWIDGKTGSGIVNLRTGKQYDSTDITDLQIRPLPRFTVLKLSVNEE